MFIVYQLDPTSINREIIQNHVDQGIDHKLVYPEYIALDYLLVPVEVGTLNKRVQNSQDLNDFDIKF